MTLPREHIEQLLVQFQTGQLDLEAATRQLAGSDQLETAAVDVDRLRRCGFTEVVYCEGKSVGSVVEIFKSLSGHGQHCLGTRVSTEQATALTEYFPEIIYNKTARTVRLPRTNQAGTPVERVGKVSLLTAGTSDLPVAEEARETLFWMDCEVDLIVDIGVAGPHRLQEQVHRLQDSDAVIVVAGMEGALPSVVGGYVDCPVIAVPTSVGYGTSFGGVTALLGMLNSCASNVTVVNIDAGFKGGYVAGLITHRIAKARKG
ncbi:AIR carboxylase [Polystyrenella longa]|uniref:AIR carboxylase n=1 Tax=Polystyrenella longa TaxID=2528007 RepID=A0A518CU13_9PLAN|nr:nickel pincer cofactor biosynthesis protein LarB [Polystyrenella longa]QDU82705.1 AIR carboxylase [Polystyrenella longa]